MKIITEIAIIVTFHLVAGLIVMFAWNVSMPQMFGMPHATWLNGLGLSILAATIRPAKATIAKPLQ